MDNLKLAEIHRRLTERIKEYINIIINEYGPYMPMDVLTRLRGIQDFSKILRIYDYGEVSAYADEENVHMPLCADRLLNIASRIPGYGINKDHKPYNSETMVINNNTFFKYMVHVFISGTNAEGYYEDLLLHEVMHFCGSGGGSVLEEGINELLTRMLAQKHGLRTNSCGYPKEVSLAYELMKCFGEDIVIRLAFMSNLDEKIEYLKNTLGSDAANMYLQVSMQAEQEFNGKYYSHMSEFSGVVGIVKKVLFYNKIDYSGIYQTIRNYTSASSDNDELKKEQSSNGKH